jgi:hypothetical protein
MEEEQMQEINQASNWIHMERGLLLGDISHCFLGGAFLNKCSKIIGNWNQWWLRVQIDEKHYF